MHRLVILSLLALGPGAEPPAEEPPQNTTATGSATISNYSPVTHTFDISVTVQNLAPATVTGFHIHQGPVGVNSPIFSSAPRSALPLSMYFSRKADASARGTARQTSAS